MTHRNDRWAGALGDEAVFAECHDRFVKYIAGDASAIHPDLRHAVFSTVRSDNSAAPAPPPPSP